MRSTFPPFSQLHCFPTRTDFIVRLTSAPRCALSRAKDAGRKGMACQSIVLAPSGTISFDEFKAGLAGPNQSSRLRGLIRELDVPLSCRDFRRIYANRFPIQQCLICLVPLFELLIRLPFQISFKSLDIKVDEH